MSNRSIINFNNDWRFSKLSGTAFSDVNPSDIKIAEWENVTLPHTWNKDDCCGAWAFTKKAFCCNPKSSQTD